MEEIITDFLIKASKIVNEEEFKIFIDSTDIITDNKIIEDLRKNRLPYGICIPNDNLLILKDKIKEKLIEKTLYEKKMRKIIDEFYLLQKIDSKILSDIYNKIKENINVNYILTNNTLFLPSQEIQNYRPFYHNKHYNQQNLLKMFFMFLGCNYIKFDIYDKYIEYIDDIIKKNKLLIRNFIITDIISYTDYDYTENMIKLLNGIYKFSKIDNELIIKDNFDNNVSEKDFVKFIMKELYFIVYYLSNNKSILDKLNNFNDVLKLINDIKFIL